MSNTTADTNCVGESAPPYYNPELYSSDTELEVMLAHARNGNKTLFTIPVIKAELKRRAAKTLASTISKQIEELVGAINFEYRTLEEKVTPNDTVSMSFDHVIFTHGLLSTHVDKVRRGVNRLKRIMGPLHSWSVPSAESEVQQG
jgi:hypothetical protein